MIRPVVLYGSPILRKVASPVSSDHSELEDLVADMFETMYAASGIGLAGPQIGIPLRLFIIGGRLSEIKDILDYEEVFINPKIEALDTEEISYEEGCLSLPGVRGSVSRPKTVVISYENIARERKKIQTDDILARIIQHEYDHIEGKLFIDYFSPLRRRMVKKKLDRLDEDTCSYPVTQI